VKFQGLVLEEDRSRTQIRDLKLNDLPAQGEVLVRTEWSGINYKDALAVTGRGKIVRSEFPFVPGIDLAGVVLESKSDKFRPGDRVLATGWGIGEEHWGGYSQMQWMSEKWLIPIPEELSTRDSMIIGTAGLTAMLSVIEIQASPHKSNTGEMLVTGATGGVGSFAVMLLADAGYAVTASSGKAEASAYLKALGALRIIPRSDLSEGAQRPLDKGRWAGCVDSVGSTTLESVLSCCNRHAVVASCGLAGGHELNTTVFPFILRGVRLIGIDSNTCPKTLRIEAWNRLALFSKTRSLDAIAHELSMSEIPAACETIISGGVTGRFLVDLQA